MSFKAELMDNIFVAIYPKYLTIDIIQFNDLSEEAIGILKYIKRIIQVAGSVQDIKDGFPEALHQNIDSIAKTYCLSNDYKFYSGITTKYEDIKLIKDKYRDSYDRIYSLLLDNLVKDK
mgnify:CR=1 FL=1